MPLRHRYLSLFGLSLLLALLLLQQPASPSHASTLRQEGLPPAEATQPTDTPGLPIVTQTASNATLTAGLPTAIATGQPSPTPCNLRFTDVPSSYLFYDDILYLACRNIVNGFPNGDGTFRFEPNSQTRRGEFAKIVTLAFSLPIPQPLRQHFSDVPSDNIFFSYIESAAAAGTVIGYPDGTFKPNRSISRSETVVILKRVHRYPDRVPAMPTFRDVPASYFAYGAIETLNSLHILSGAQCVSGNGRCFRPNEPIRRGELSKVVHRSSETNAP